MGEGLRWKLFLRLCFNVILLQLLVEAFRKVAVKAKDVEAKKQKERKAEEKRRQEVLRKKREQEQQSQADVTELTDEEAERMQKEIDARKYKPILLF